MDKFNDVIFGGAFNPITTAHVELIKQTVDWFNGDIDKFSVYVVPTIEDAFGKPLIDFDKRVQWIQQAVDGMDGVVVDDEGMDKYTHDYIKIVRTQYDANEVCINLLMGSDVLPTLHKWKNWKLLINQCRFLVALRGNKTKGLTNLKKYDIIGKVTSGVSSTKVRDYIRDGKDIRGMVPECIRKEVIKTYDNK